jgi:predicted site-specific integrase-resolvase
MLQTADPTPAVPPPDSNPWVTVTAYAARHGISRRTVWYWVEKGIIEVSRKTARTGVRVRDAQSSAI